MYKTHNCGELRASDAGKTVTLAGWVHRYRNHGGVYFVDLRDRYGLTQIVIDPSDEKMAELCQSIRFEWVLQVTGVVQLRAGTPNPNLPTGEIEVPAQTIKVLNTCKVLPFSINNPEEKVDEQRASHNRQNRPLCVQIPQSVAHIRQHKPQRHFFI